MMEMIKDIFKCKENKCCYELQCTVYVTFFVIEIYVTYNVLAN